jgi:hypothetical protein
MTWLERFKDFLQNEEKLLTDNETLPHEPPKSEQSVNVPDTIDEMSHEEREAAFRDEIIAPNLIPALRSKDWMAEEMVTLNLIGSMKILYRVPDIDVPAAEWLSQTSQSNQGRNKSELDAELYEIINKRLNEPGHINLPNKNYLKIQEWRRYREKESETPIQEIPETSLPDGTEDDSAHRTKEPEYEDSFGNRVALQLQQHLESTLVTDDIGPTCPNCGSPGWDVTGACTICGHSENRNLSLVTKDGVAISMGVLTARLNQDWAKQKLGEDGIFWDKDWQFSLERRNQDWVLIPNSAPTNDTLEVVSCSLLEAESG